MSEQKLESLFKKAEIFYQRNDLPKAIDTFSQILQLEKSVDVYLNRGRLFFQQQNYRLAISDLTESLSYMDTLTNPQDVQQALFTIFKYLSQAKSKVNLKSQAIQDLQNIIPKIKNPNYLKEIYQILLQLRSIRPQTSNALEQDILEQEKNKFVQLYRQGMAVYQGDTWHVLSCKWFKMWQIHVGLISKQGYEDLPFSFNIQSSEKIPELIDNSDIINLQQSKVTIEDPQKESFNIVLKTGISENINYVLIPDKAFQYLSQIYGVLKDIKRYPIEVNDSIYQVEVHLKKIQITSAQYPLKLEVMQVSRKDSIEEVQRRFKSVSKISSLTKVWKVNMNMNSLERLSQLCRTDQTVFIEGGSLLEQDVLIDDAELAEDDILVIELKKNEKFLFSDDRKIAHNRCGFCQKSKKLNYKCRNCQTVEYCSNQCRVNHQKEHKSNCIRKPSRLDFLRCFCRRNQSYDDSDQQKQTVLKLARTTSTNSRQGLTGLQNLGNTCFMNTGLQCLSHTIALTQYFLTNKFVQDINKSNPLGTKGKLVLAYYQLIQALWNGTSSTFGPWKFKKVLAQFAPQFLGYQQHDSHQLLCYILDGLHQDLNKVKQKPYFSDDKALEGKPDFQAAQIAWERHLLRNKSIIVNLMHGQYKSTIYCPICHNYSYAFDPFNSLSLPLSLSYQKLSFYFIFSNPANIPVSFTIEGEYRNLGETRSKIKEFLDLQQDNFVFVHIQNKVVKQFLQDDTLIQKANSYVLFVFQFQQEIAGKIPIEVKITRDPYRSRYLAYPRIVLIPQNSSILDLHKAVFQKMKFHLDNQTKEFTYEDFQNNPVYNLSYSLRNLEGCPNCRTRRCQGCDLPKTSDLIPLSENIQKICLRFNQNFDRNNKIMAGMNKCRQIRQTSRLGGKLPSTTIYKSFEQFRVPEKLDKANAWYCSKCKKHVQATKQLQIYKVPPILIIHLKRFKSHGYFRQKLAIPVEFPERGLDISEYVLGQQRPPLYDLYGVSNHFGSLGGGHYTALCYNPNYEQWFDFNDSTISRAKERSAQSAYVLFYKARTPQQL